MKATLKTSLLNKKNVISFVHMQINELLISDSSENLKQQTPAFVSKHLPHGIR